MVQRNAMVRDVSKARVRHGALPFWRGVGGAMVCVRGGLAMAVKARVFVGVARSGMGSEVAGFALGVVMVVAV
jgi:hypothetical protein